MLNENKVVEIVVKGQVHKPGTYQVAPGQTMQDVIFGLAGGLAAERFQLKAVLIGGSIGHFASAAELIAPVTTSQEVMVFDDGSCLVNVVRLLLLYNKSRPQTGCSNCRATLSVAVGLLNKLTTPAGSKGDVEELIRFSGEENPNCPSRCSALSPLKSALALWPEEFYHHAAGYCPAAICTELMISPCANSCPANVDLPGTIALMQMSKYSDALALGRHDNPLFLTCGYVCEEPPCQKNCKRINFDQAIYSQSLHRYAGDKAAAAAGSLEKALRHVTLAKGTVTGKTVAIAGAGPAGLSAAYFLARMGHNVTIYEKNSLPGGMAAFGIPAYRLPRAVVAAEAGTIADLGVEIRSGQALGTEITLDQLRSEYDAVLLAVGAGKSRKLGIPGEDLPAIQSALEFLHEAAEKGTATVGGRLLVVGGGNVAVDVARTARRLGAQTIEMMCVEDKFEMPASANEIAAAKGEGIILRPLSVPIEFVSDDNGSVLVKYAPVEPGPYDAKGRRWPPRALANLAQTQTYDAIVIAIGQIPDLDCLNGYKLAQAGPFIASNGNHATSEAGIFVAGDCGGPLNTVVKAVGAGKKAAYAINEYLTGSTRDLSSPLRQQLGCFSGQYTCQPAECVVMPEQAIGDRMRNFDPVELGLTDKDAAYEMLRCICAAKGGRL